MLALNECLKKITLIKPFYQKVNLILKLHLENLWVPYGGWALTGCRGMFGGFCNFLLFMSSQVFESVRNPLKITLHSSHHSTALLAFTMVPNMQFKEIGPSYIFLNNALSESMFYFSAIWGWCLHLDFVTLIECYNSYFPPTIIFNTNLTLTESAK